MVSVQTQNGLSPSARTCHSFYMFMKAFKADLTHNVNAIKVNKDITVLVFQPLSWQIECILVYVPYLNKLLIKWYNNYFNP